MILKELDYAVIERLGRFRTVFFRGRHLCIPILDRVRERGTLDLQKLEPFTNTEQMKCRDGIASIDTAELWYRIGKSQDVSLGNWERVTEDVKKWTYRDPSHTRLWENPQDQVCNMVSVTLQLLLSRMTIAEANAKRIRLADDVAAIIAPGIEKLGIHLPSSSKKPLILGPIFPYCPRSSKR